MKNRKSVEKFHATKIMKYNKALLLDKLKFFKGLTSDSINIIIENSNDRNKLYNEIEKILIYFDNKKLKMIN